MSPHTRTFLDISLNLKRVQAEVRKVRRVVRIGLGREQKLHAGLLEAAALPMHSAEPVAIDGIVKWLRHDACTLFNVRERNVRHVWLLLGLLGLLDRSLEVLSSLYELSLLKVNPSTTSYNGQNGAKHERERERERNVNGVHTGVQ